MSLEWAAGLFEGEGTIGMDKRRVPPSLNMSLKSTDEDVVRKLGTVLGGHVTGPYGPYDNGDSWNRKPFWMWSASGVGAVEILVSILPYLCSRRTARAKECLALVRTVRRSRSEAGLAGAQRGWETRRARAGV